MSQFIMWLKIVGFCAIAFILVYGIVRLSPKAIKWEEW